MRSKEAEQHLIENILIVQGQEYLLISPVEAKKAVELAEEEMIEKAMAAFDEISWMIGWSGCSADEAEEKFINKLNE